MVAVQRDIDVLSRQGEGDVDFLVVDFGHALAALAQGRDAHLKQISGQTGRLTASNRLASETKGTPVRSVSPEAQVETVETPIRQSSGMSDLAKRLAQALSSGTSSPLSPA